jgi:hypothetical protein
MLIAWPAPAASRMRDGDVFKPEDCCARPGRADAFRCAACHAITARRVVEIQTRSSLERPPALHFAQCTESTTLFTLH